MELLISIVIGILIVEAYAWLPKLSHWLIDRAVQRLRVEEQDRCREEWSAGLAALPNTVIRLVHAISCIGAAHRINTDFAETKLTEINALIEELGHKHSGMVVSFRAAKDSFNRSGLALREKLDHHRAELKTHLVDPPNKQVASSWEKLIRNMEKLIDSYAGATDRSRELLAVCVDRTGERLNHVQSLIRNVSQKRDQVTKLFGRRGVTPDRLDGLLTDLANDLNTVKSIFEDDKWGDDDAFREHHRIQSAIRGAMQPIVARRG